MNDLGSIRHWSPLIWSKNDVSWSEVYQPYNLSVVSGVFTIFTDGR